MTDRGPSIVIISALGSVCFLLMAALKPPQTNTRETPMQIDTQKLKDECRREMEQAYREGWKAGYLDGLSVSPYSVNRLRMAWNRGFHDGNAERAKDEAKAKEAQQ